MRKIGHDHLTVDAVQIVEDSKCCLKVNAVITKVGVYDYPDGRAFKSPMELLKASRTARSAKIAVLDHPPDPMPVIMSQTQMKGNVERAFFDRDKIRALLNFDKHENTKEFIESVRAAAAQTGKPLDVSIGFYYKQDVTPGQWKDATGIEHPYDYVMRDIVIDHVACGVARGRCSFPNCGIGVDSLITGHLKMDYETMEECIADNGDKEDPAAFCAWLLKQTGVCTPAQIDAYMKRLKEKMKKMGEDPKEAFIKAKELEGVTREEAEAQYAELTSAPGQKGTQGAPDPKLSLTPEQLKDADYDWDTCVSDRIADGYSEESAKKICNAIKLRTVSHAAEFYGLKTPKDAVAFVINKCKTDKLFAYTLDSMTKRFEAEAKAAKSGKGKKDAALEAKFCALCGTALVDNKCPNKECSVFGKTVSASSDKAKGTDSAVELSTDELVQRSQTLLEMKAEEDIKARIEERKPH